MKSGNFLLYLTIFTILLFVFIQPYLYVGIKTKDELRPYVMRGLIEIIHGKKEVPLPLMIKIYTSFANLRLLRIILTILLIILVFIVHFLKIDYDLRMTIFSSIIGCCLILGLVNILGIFFLLTPL